MMNEVQNDVEVYATFQNILCWWFVFVLLDAAIWGGLMSLHSAYIAVPQRGTFQLKELFGLPLLGVVGKMMLLQSPCLLIFACIFRKRLLLHKRYLYLLPTVSFFVGFSIMLLRHLLDDGLDQTIRLFRGGFNFREFSDTTIPMSLISTIIATVPWSIYLQRRFRDLKH